MQPRSLASNSVADDTLLSAPSPAGPTNLPNPFRPLTLSWRPSTPAGVLCEPVSKAHQQSLPASRPVKQVSELQIFSRALSSPPNPIPGLTSESVADPGGTQCFYPSCGPPQHPPPPPQAHTHPTVSASQTEKLILPRKPSGHT